MSAHQEPLCIQCGHEIGEATIPELADGTPCPACRDRVLESTPAPFPFAPAESAVEAESYVDDDEPPYRA